MRTNSDGRGEAEEIGGLAGHNGRTMSMLAEGLGRAVGDAGFGSFFANGSVQVMENTVVASFIRALRLN